MSEHFSNHPGFTTVSLTQGPAMGSALRHPSCPRFYSDAFCLSFECHEFYLKAPGDWTPAF